MLVKILSFYMKFIWIISLIIRFVYFVFILNSYVIASILKQSSEYLEKNREERR